MGHKKQNFKNRHRPHVVDLRNNNDKSEPKLDRRGTQLPRLNEGASHKKPQTRGHRQIERVDRLGLVSQPVYPRGVKLDRDQPVYPRGPKPPRTCLNTDILQKVGVMHRVRSSV